MLLGYVVLWYYWQGRNWARILVILNVSLAIFNLFPIRRLYSSSVLYDSVVVANAVLGAFPLVLA